MVSIIIPIYNSGSSTINSIKSVLFQTYNDWEIIIIDDGSIDDSFEIVFSFLKSLPKEESDKIILHRQINQGPSAARNQGINLSRGEYIAFLDSDDEWKRDKLEIQMRYMKNDESIYLSATAFEKNKFNDYLKFKVISFNQLLFKNYFSTPTVIVKKEVFREYMFDINQKYSEDYKLWLQIAYEYKCIYINSVLANNQFKKREYGDHGLSSNLIAMEKGEISNFIFLYQSNKINILELIICLGYSISKFILRVFKSYVL